MLSPVLPRYGNLIYIIFSHHPFLFAFLNVSVEPQLINSLNMANYTYNQGQKVFRNPINNLKD